MEYETWMKIVGEKKEFRDRDYVEIELENGTITNGCINLLKASVFSNPEHLNGEYFNYEKIKFIKHLE